MTARATCPCCGSEIVGAAPLASVALLGGSRHRRMMMERLVKAFPRTVTRASLICTIYGDDPDGGPLMANASMRNIVFQMNKELRPMGWAIVGARGPGADAWRIARVQ